MNNPNKQIFYSYIIQSVGMPYCRIGIDISKIAKKYIRFLCIYIFL